MKILVTGGAGYIGSITNMELWKRGVETVVFDNLIYGHRQAVAGGVLEVGDLLRVETLRKIFKKYKFDGVIHFAAYVLAGESMHDPYKYFNNNIQGGLNLLRVMAENSVKKIIFSSSCAVYGYPKKLPVTEKEELKPVSVYGETKVSFEKILYWYDKLFKIKYVSLRYFNAAGASLDGAFGGDHKPETHIIPLAIQAAMGLRDYFKLFGNDYPTKDGTCIRDYIHVLDLSSAHILALEKLEKGESAIYNLGAEKGYSNLEVLKMVKKVTGRDFLIKIGKRREGDPAAIFADSTKIKKELGWKPGYSDLKTIVETAWKWHKTHPKGYQKDAILVNRYFSRKARK